MDNRVISALGTADNPLTLERAFSGFTPIKSGHVLLLRDKRPHSGVYVSPLAGVTVRPLDGRPRIDGGITVKGQDVIFRDLEITYGGWTKRQTLLSGSSPADMPLVMKLDIFAPRVKFINCIIHDLSGVGLWTNAVSAEFYGNIIYNIGWLGPDRGHGHGLYCQNIAGTRMTIRHNIIHDCFGWGIHAYSSSGIYLQDMDILGNICFSAGSLAGSPRPNILVGADKVQANSINVVGNCTYNGAVGVSFYGGGAANVTLENNILPDGVGGAYQATSEGNNVTKMDDRVVVYKNDYDANRLHVAIYNAAEAKSVNVDVSKHFEDGVVLSVRNAQDYYNDVQTLIVKGGAVSVSMTGTVAAPVAWSSAPSTFPRFGAFVMERQ